MRPSRLFVALSVALVLALGCKKGSKKGGRLASEKLRPHVAALAKVDPASISISMDEEIARNLWFARAQIPNGPEYRCFVDPQEVLCDRGEGRIFRELVAHRRLGDNRASIDDPAWVAMVRHAYGLKFIFPEPGFPIASGIDPKRDLRVPLVERPDDGGVIMSVWGVDARGQTVRIDVKVVGEGDANVTIKPLP
ncbi:MAG: hypothetical protein HYV09_03920 [Deltaproteobacteria bacterium]|nr:hypothetical protein [Deltaproteobacteria bacterium]